MKTLVCLLVLATFLLLAFDTSAALKDAPSFLSKLAQDNLGQQNVEHAVGDARNLVKSLITGDVKNRNAAVVSLGRDAVNMGFHYVLNPNTNLDRKLRSKILEAFSTYRVRKLLKTA